MKKLSLVFFVILVLTLTLALSACAADGKDGVDGKDGIDGKDGVTPTIEISEDGYWIINGTKTEYKAIGTDGKDGVDGEDGKDGAPGKDGVDGENGAPGKDGVDGENGAPGKDGVDGEDGKDGAPGKDGVDGINGVGIVSTTMDENGNIVITYTNGTTEIIEHNWVYQYTLITSTCAEAGIDLYSCEECSLARMVIIDALGHSWNTITTHPTCQTGGFDTKTCFTCGEVVICNETAIIDHQYPDQYESNNSFHWKKCNSCDNTIENTEHTLGEHGICTVCDALIGDTVGIIYDVSADGTYAEVISYTGTSTRIKIAKEYKGLPVRTIYEKAFYNQDKITSVVIPDSVTSIGNFAFYSCGSLTSVTIPDSVTRIGYSAFFCCSSLTSVIIGDGVISIDNFAFYSCDSLTSVRIGDSVTTIGEDAFAYCYSLTSVTIPDSVTYIGDDAFDSC